MNENILANRTQLSRQIEHWGFATSRLGDLNNFASPSAWNGLERYLGTTIRETLKSAVRKLQLDIDQLRTTLKTFTNEDELSQIQRQLIEFRKEYLRTEITIDFYADAIIIRSNPKLEPLLRAFDSLAYRSLKDVLDQLGKQTPLVLTYIDKGLGASILKAGLRLWDKRTQNPAAAIKIVNHNLFRPTALIHETGHQMAHITGWNEELSFSLEDGISDYSSEIGELWGSWSSEIAADAFAFVHTGYASVAGLHDVLSGGSRFVFRHRTGDPHPISYLRVLLGIEMCRQFYGAGQWDNMARVWIKTYPIHQASSETQKILKRSIPIIPRVAIITLTKPMKSFGGRSISSLVDPMRVSPESLIHLEQKIGPALFTSIHWVWTESMRLLALTGYKAATEPDGSLETMQEQKNWMFQLGESLKAA